MNIGIKWSVLRDTSWHQYLIRFVLGGAVMLRYPSPSRAISRRASFGAAAFWSLSK
jgi:hypothetical protein